MSAWSRASAGLWPNVVCVDSDAEKIAALKRGGCPIFEPGRDDLI
jgi:UDP-glucose 6-dehydrogenase